MKEEMMHIVKKDKKKLLILSVLAVLAVFLLVVGNQMGSSSASSPQSDVLTYSVTGTSFSETESQLEAVLGSINGVGKVEVIISRDGDVSESYAYNEEYAESVKEDGSTEITEKKELVLVDGNGAPVVTEREYPDILGVLVVAEGAGNDRVKEDLLDAVASYLAIGKNRIEITAMEVQ